MPGPWVRLCLARGSESATRAPPAHVRPGWSWNDGRLRRLTSRSPVPFRKTIEEREPAPILAPRTMESIREDARGSPPPPERLPIPLPTRRSSHVCRDLRASRDASIPPWPSKMPGCGSTPPVDLEPGGPMKLLLALAVGAALYLVPSAAFAGERILTAFDGKDSLRWQTVNDGVMGGRSQGDSSRTRERNPALRRRDLAREQRRLQQHSHPPPGPAARRLRRPRDPRPRRRADLQAQPAHERHLELDRLLGRLRDHGGRVDHGADPVLEVGSDDLRPEARRPPAQSLVDQLRGLHALRQEGGPLLARGRLDRRVPGHAGARDHAADRRAATIVETAQAGRQLQDPARRREGRGPGRCALGGGPADRLRADRRGVRQAARRAPSRTCSSPRTGTPCARCSCTTWSRAT